MSECVFVGVEQDPFLVVVSCTSVWLKCEDVGSNDVFDDKVGRVDRFLGWVLFDA